MKRKSRQVPRLQSTLHSRLGIYSAGAVTGALSIVSSDAAIVYVNSGVLLTDNLTTDGSYTAWSIDFNGDAVSDMRIWTKDATGSAAPLANNAFITAPAQAGGNVGVLGVTNANNFHYPSRLAAGATIDGSAVMFNLTLPVQNLTQVGVLAYGNGVIGTSFGTAPATSGYVGFRFNIGANQHFGWMRITVTDQGVAGTRPRSVRLHEWGYEDVPNAGIAAGAMPVPEPTSLGLLALGSLGLAAHRRRKLAS